MDIFLIIIAILCGVIGIIGSVLPILPGPALSFVGLMCAYFTDGSTITQTALWIWGIITIVISILDYILPGYFSKMFGGSKAGIIGATIGVFVGMFMGPMGIILGPFVGAVAGEMLNQRLVFSDALKVGFGSLLSFIVGSGMKLIITGMMMYYIWKDMFLQIKDMF